MSECLGVSQLAGPLRVAIPFFVSPRSARSVGMSSPLSDSICLAVVALGRRSALIRRLLKAARFRAVQDRILRDTDPFDARRGMLQSDAHGRDEQFAKVSRV